LAKIADTLSGESAIGRLSQVCERWIYSSCLCFALDLEVGHVHRAALLMRNSSCLCFALSLEERQKSGFRYRYSDCQMEYSRNLPFERGGRMDEVFQTSIDRSRTALNSDTIKTILGA